MSISGDSVIMRNGRTTSQVSIYNYPEHLNPFYEEDQHKRLRFWKLNRNASSNNNNERWKSISITSLKDLWPMKSFRFSKKKSSTLGVNKTSESPTILRRDLADYNHTLNRSSLQNEPYAKRATSMGFERNADYRSTIQVMGGQQNVTRYNYGRSVTPQPQRSNFMETPTLNRRSGSRTSTTSTNPFAESDDDYDVENYFHRGPMQTQSLMPSQRKKRRAPIPAALLHKTTSSESSSQLNNTNTSKSETEEVDQSLNISNLASQIENFVNTLDERDAEVAQKEEVNRTPTKSNGTIPPLAQSTPKIVVVKAESIETKTNMEKPAQEVIIKETNVNVVKPAEEVEIKAQNTMPQSHIKEEVTILEVKATNTNVEKPSKVEKTPEVQIEAKEEKVKETKVKVNASKNIIVEDVVVEKDINMDQSRKNVTLKTPFILTTPPTPTPSPKVEQEEPPLREIVVFGPLTGPEKPKRSSLNKRTVEFLEQEQMREEQRQLEQELQRQKEEEKAYLESRNFTKKPEIAKKPEVTNDETQLQQQRQELVTKMFSSTTSTSAVHYANGESTGAIPRTRDWKDSTLAPLQSSVPPEKRKSAKEIIESINRQQRLLKEAAERNMPDTKNSNGRLQGVIIYNHYQQTAVNSNDLDKTQKQMIKNKLDNTDPSKLENGSPVFAKCRIFKENFPQRESSPTTSNLDWNPLPKPKRNKDIPLD